MNRFLLPVVLATLASCAAAQTPADPPKPAIPETPPDVKAYTDAVKLTDPQDRIAALQKWKTDFPHSSMRSAADSSILDTLIKKLPDEHERIRKQAKSVYRDGDSRQREQVAGSIAIQLLDGDVLLSDAEVYARKSIATPEDKYLTAEKARYSAGKSGAKSKGKPPSDEALRKRFRESHAARMATLGRIEVKLGRVEQGRQMLEEAYAANSNLPEAAAVLGELAAKDGNDAKALDLLIIARLSGKAPASANAALDVLYRKTHSGSLDGIDEMLDREYNKRFSNPLKLETYRPSEKRSDRLVLAEVFTGSGCPPCVGADLAFDAASQRYSRKDLAILSTTSTFPAPTP